MRVAHIVNSFSPLSETFIYDYITELERSDVNNHVMTFGHDNIVERPFDNVHLVPLPSRWQPERVWEKIKRGLHIIEANESHLNICRRHLFPYLKKLNPDVIHAHFGPMGVLVAPLAKELGIPFITTFYGYDISSLLKDPVWQRLYRDLLIQMAAATVLSQDMSRNLINLGMHDKDVKTVHLGKRLEDYNYRKPERSVKNWVSVGRLVEKKGHLDCIKAFAKVTRGVTLTIIGEGDLLPTLNRYVQQNKLSGRVEIIGSRPHHEVKRLMAEADAFILCSKIAGSGDSEGTPTVLMEAQALGLPCVSTKHSGIPEVIAKENHWLLAEEGNIDEIGNCVNKLMKCSVEELETISRAGRAKVEAEFNITVEVKKLIGLYEAI